MAPEEGSAIGDPKADVAAVDEPGHVGDMLS